MTIVIAVNETDAASALGIGKTAFRELVSEGHLPKPRRVPDRRRIIWDIDELKTAFRCWQRDDEDNADDDDQGEDWD